MSGTFKTGRYSKYIKAPELLNAYQELLTDDDFLSLRDEIAVLTARNSQLLDQLNGRNSHDLWLRLQKEYQAFQRETDNDKRQLILQDIFRYIAAGGKDFEVWRELSGNIDLISKLSQKEQQRIIKSESMIMAPTAYSMIYAFAEIVKRNVRKYVDKQTAGRILSEVGRDIEALVGDDGGGAAES